VTYWQRWHDAYADPTSSLSRRLRVVQDQVARWLDETAPRPVRVLSLCAGDGRDVLEVLATRTDVDRVTATLVELDSDLCARARGTARGMEGIEVLTADAGDLGAYADRPAADLVLLCGVLGNISDADVEHTIAALPSLCVPGARVIWTRTRRAPDLTPLVRAWFSDNGFREVDFLPVSQSAASVGVADLVVPPRSRHEDGRLFTFLPGSRNARALAPGLPGADAEGEARPPRDARIVKGVFPDAPVTLER